jgi:hypothetical protein
MLGATIDNESGKYTCTVCMPGLFASKVGLSSRGVSAPLSSAGVEAREETVLSSTERCAVCEGFSTGDLSMGLRGRGVGTWSRCFMRTEGRAGRGRSGAGAGARAGAAIGLGALVKSSRSRLVVLWFDLRLCVGRREVDCEDSGERGSELVSGSRSRPSILAALAPLTFILRGAVLSSVS